jgi:hypothetical protein
VAGCEELKEVNWKEAVEVEAITNDVTNVKHTQQIQHIALLSNR